MRLNVCYTGCIGVMSGFTGGSLRMGILYRSSFKRWPRKGFGQRSIYSSLHHCLCWSLNGSVFKTSALGVVLIGNDPHYLNLLPSHHKSLTLTQTLQLRCFIA